MQKMVKKSRANSTYKSAFAPNLIRAVLLISLRAETLPVVRSILRWRRLLRNAVRKVDGFTRC